MQSNFVKNKIIRSLNTYSKVFNIHIKDKNKKDIFIFSAPRSGSTWLMEMISSQPGIKYYSEPTNIREEYLRKKMRVNSWADLLPNKNREKIFYEYFIKLQRNRVKLYNPSPFQPNYHFITNRIVFKMMYANDMIDWLEKNFNGFCLFLIRHPIPVSLSRKGYPVLEYFINNKEYMDKYFTAGQQKVFKDIVIHGTHLEKGTIDWIIQNYPPLLKLQENNWIFTTYEELVLKTKFIMSMITEKLNLPDINKINKVSGRASKTAKTQSNQETIDIIKNKDLNDENKIEYLIGKWKKRVNEDEEKKVFEIIDNFDIDIYSYNQLAPNNKYLNFKSEENIEN